MYPPWRSSGGGLYEQLKLLIEEVMPGPCPECKDKKRGSKRRDILASRLKISQEA